jgi:hypothetical protein
MPTYHKLIFKTSDINASLQVNDVAYKVSGNVTTRGFTTYNDATPVILGTIKKVGHNYIHIQDMQNAPSQDDFIMFAKNQAVNKSGVKGYYAEVKLKNNNPNEISELFSIASELSPSSK